MKSGFVHNNGLTGLSDIGLPGYYPQVPKPWDELTLQQKEEDNPFATRPKWARYQSKRQKIVRLLEFIKSLGRKATKKEVDLLTIAYKNSQIFIKKGNTLTGKTPTAFLWWLQDNPGKAQNLEHIPGKKENYFLYRQFSEDEKARLARKKKNLTKADLMKISAIEGGIQIIENNSVTAMKAGFLENWINKNPQKVSRLVRKKGNLFEVKPKPKPQPKPSPKPKPQPQKTTDSRPVKNKKNKSKSKRVYEEKNETPSGNQSKQTYQPIGEPQKQIGGETNYNYDNTIRKIKKYKWMIGIGATTIITGLLLSGNN